MPSMSRICLGEVSLWKVNRIIKIDTSRTKISPDGVFPNKMIQNNSNKEILKVWVKQFSTGANVLTPLPEVFNIIKIWWFFIFIIRCLPQHNTVSIDIYTYRRAIALFWYRHVQPTKIQIQYTYNRYFRYRVFSWCFTIWCTNWVNSNCFKQRFPLSICDFNGFLLCVRCWVSEKTKRDSYLHSKKISENFWQTEITKQSITIDIINKNLTVGYNFVKYLVVNNFELVTFYSKISTFFSPM